MNINITTCLWFEGNAKEAAEFYCSVFKGSKILSENPFVVEFQINNTKLIALNGRVKFDFNESFSLVVQCDDQTEIDYYWNALTTDGGEESMCGWLKDKFGVSWQIVPSILPQLMADPERSQRVINAFLQMQKFDIDTLLNA